MICKTTQKFKIKYPWLVKNKQSIFYIFLFVLFLIPKISFSQTAEEYYKKGVTKYTLHDFKNAASDFSKIIELDPRNVNALIYRGNCKSNLNDNKGALEDLTKAIEINPKEALAYYNRGHV